MAIPILVTNPKLIIDNSNMYRYTFKPQDDGNIVGKLHVSKKSGSRRGGRGPSSHKSWKSFTLPSPITCHGKGKEQSDVKSRMAGKSPYIY